MFPLKKKSDAEPAAAPRWHPNFRNFESLPDTKVVRTTFFVNTAAIVLACVLLLLAGQKYFHIYSLGQQIAAAQKQIDDNAKQNNEAIRLNNLFQAEAKKFQDADEFVRTPISPTEFIQLLGQTLPKEISIEFVENRYPSAQPGPAPGVILRGLVAGTPDQAAGTAASYVDSLRGNKKLKAIFDTITLDKLNRDPSVNLMSFEIALKFKSDGKEKKK